jgi:hypothetical protein
MVALGIILGMGLLYTGSSTPVMLVELYLVVRILLSPILAIGAGSTRIGQAVGASLSSVIGLLYFRKSRRVRSTYLDDDTAVANGSPLFSTKMKVGATILVVVVMLAAIILPLRSRNAKGSAGVVSVAPENKTSVSSESGQAEADMGARTQSLSHEVDTAADSFDAALTDLKNLGSVNMASEAERGIAAIEKTQSLHANSNSRNQDLVDFVERNKQELQAKGYGQVVDLIATYGDTYHAYHTALSDFLNSYTKMLHYLRDHSEAIKQNQSAERKQYDALYGTYIKAMKRQNGAYYRHLAFLRSYADQHPSVSTILKEQIPKETR